MLRGSQCVNCAALSTKEDAPCVYCDGPVRAVADLIEFASARVLQMQGKVEEVRGAAAERLQQDGGVGAFLRF